MIDWWLYLKTELPDDPLEVTRQCNWGQDHLAKVNALIHKENHTTQLPGQPALYDQRYRC